MKTTVRHLKKIIYRIASVFILTAVMLTSTMSVDSHKANATGSIIQNKTVYRWRDVRDFVGYEEGKSYKCLIVDYKEGQANSYTYAGRENGCVGRYQDWHTDGTYYYVDMLENYRPEFKTNKREFYTTEDIPAATLTVVSSSDLKRPLSFDDYATYADSLLFGKKSEYGDNLKNAFMLNYYTPSDGYHMDMYLSPGFDNRDQPWYTESDFTQNRSKVIELVTYDSDRVCFVTPSGWQYDYDDKEKLAEIEFLALSPLLILNCGHFNYNVAESKMSLYYPKYQYWETDFSGYAGHLWIGEKLTVPVMSGTLTGQVLVCDDAYIEKGTTVTIEKDGVLVVNGAIHNAGTIINKGMIIVRDGGIIEPYGLTSDAEGKIICDGSKTQSTLTVCKGGFVNMGSDSGPLVLSGSAFLDNKGTMLLPYGIAYQKDIDAKDNKNLKSDSELTTIRNDGAIFISCIADTEHSFATVENTKDILEKLENIKAKSSGSGIKVNESKDYSSVKLFDGADGFTSVDVGSVWFPSMKSSGESRFIGIGICYGDRTKG